MSECQQLRDIEANIRNLAKVQESVNEAYNNLTIENYKTNYTKIMDGLYEEHYLLDTLTENLNDYFNITSRFRFKRFRIIEEEFSCGRYVIRTPLFFDKNGWRYTLLKKLLMDLHKEYFLNNGGIDYAFTSLEYHMWEIPNFIKENEVTRQIRKDKNLKKP